MDNPANDAWDSVIYSWDNGCHFLNENWCLTGGLAVIFVLLLVTCVLNRRCWKFMSHHLKTVAGVVFLLGVALYFIGFNDHGSRNNIFALLLRASMSSIEMFVSESDLLEIKHDLHNSPLYMTVFSMVHFLAVFVSGIFILRLFGQRMVSKVHLWSKRFTTCRQLYVFWGIDEKNMILAESIKRERNDLFVFVNFPNEHHMHSSRFSFSHFFYSSDGTAEQYVNRIESLRGLVVTASRGIDDNLVSSDGWAGFYHKLGLLQLGKIVNRYKKVEFFFLSDSVDDNVEAVSVLKKLAVIDRTESGDKRFAMSERIDIYCHARRNNFTEGILSCPGLEYKVHLVDSSLLSVLQLKENGDYMKEYGRNHPVNFVDVDTATATVSSAFTAMIIGFGESGSDMLRFLYEFSTFVKETRKGADGLDDIVAQERKIYVVDKEMEYSKTRFLTEAPALGGSDVIEWLDGMPVESQSFWNRLKDIIDDLNFVVVTVDNDDKASAIAIKLFEFAYRYRRCMDKFKIYVRLRSGNNKKEIEEINKYKVKDAVDGSQVNGIEAFGVDEDIFSYANISAVSKEIDAKDYYYHYSILAKEIDSYCTNDEKRQDINKILEQRPEELWQKRRNDIIKRYTIENEVKINYQEEQDRSDVCHIYTKLVLAGVLDGRNHIDTDRLLHMVDITTRDVNNKYPNAHEDIDRVLINNLSYCEHLRWNAKMELLGFVHGENKDFKRKTHHCIVSCNELIRNKRTRETLIYDTGVVELSYKKARGWAKPLR